MIRDIVVGLTVMTIPWALIIALVSSRLVWGNRRKFASWWRQDRETRVRMSLWIATPLIMGTLTWQNAVATSNYLQDAAEALPLANMVQVVIYRPLFLAGAAFALWYIFNRVYHPDFAFIDGLWLIVVSVGLALGVLASTLSYIY